MRQMRLGCMAAVSAAQADLPPSERLTRIRLQMAQTLARLPDYTCRETIERSVRPAHAKQFQTRDTVRIDVAYLGGRELYAWPGSPRLGDKTILEMVPEGSILK